MKESGITGVTVTDRFGIAVARGHSEKAGDSIGEQLVVKEKIENIQASTAETVEDIEKISEVIQEVSDLPERSRPAALRC